LGGRGLKHPCILGGTMTDIFPYQYCSLVSRFEELMLKESRTAEEEREVDILAKAIKEFEARLVTKL